MSFATSQDVFPTVGKPTYTYVAQRNGEHESYLKEAILSRGQLCLLTGPSKLGKTTLYRKVLQQIDRQPLVIRCTHGLGLREFWASALEDLDFSQIVERVKGTGGTLTGEIGLQGEFGWSWLAKLTPSLKMTGSNKDELETRQSFIKAEIGAKHLIPLLSKAPVQLVIEDFHYLSEEVKREVFQQWKSFVDEGVSVLVVSTTHHAADIARANPDLRGRTRHLELGRWDKSDLALIPKLGFDKLGFKVGPSFRQCVSTEACGLPIVAQQVCQTFSLSLDHSSGSKDRRREFSSVHLKPALTKVVSDFYADFERDYERLLAGPRSGSRKYDTYGAILAAFALEPLEFSLRKQHLVNRVNEISESKIPAASINSSLNALAAHQKRMGTTLLEWQSNQDMLHILEPTFLFFLRQKVKTASLNTETSDVLQELIRILKEQSAVSPRIRPLS